jgi:acyl-coenzyme A synthetase/AMP-(fatty) acid ligase
VDPVFLPRPLLLVDVLPRNRAGKLSQESVRELAANHGFAAAAQADGDARVAEVTPIALGAA